MAASPSLGLVGASHGSLSAWLATLGEAGPVSRLCLLVPEASSAGLLELAPTPPRPGRLPAGGPGLPLLLDEEESQAPGRRPLFLGHHYEPRLAPWLALPTPLFSEKEVFYYSLLGLGQSGRLASRPPHRVWEEAGLLASLVPDETCTGLPPRLPPRPAPRPAPRRGKPPPVRLFRVGLGLPMSDFLRNDSLSRNSPTLALASSRLGARSSSFSPSPFPG